jgi:nucleotide-binding universal stress UspA family protein
VVGHRGRGLSRAVLGSVSDEVVRRSSRPVLVGAGVRPDDG